jgi:outer membrane protein insertion porin family
MTKNFLKVSILILTFLIISAFILPIYAQNSEEKIILDIKIKGSRIIEKSTIFYALKSKIGEPLSTDKVDRDLKALYALGFFDDIQFKVEEVENGVNLIIVVDEKPVIEEIQVLGVEKIDLEKIKKELSINTGKIIDSSKVAADVQKIKNMYIEKGYFFVEVESKIEPVSEHVVSVTYIIHENSKVKIKKITISGNKGISDFEIKKYIQTNESFLHDMLHCILKFFKKCGKFNSDTLDMDMDIIRELYKDKGYVDIQVGQPVITYKKNKKNVIKGITIDIPVTEGEKYKFGKISVSGNTVFFTDQLTKQFKDLVIPGKQNYKIIGTNKQNLVMGETYSITTVKLAALRMIDLYSSEGYINAYPYPRETQNKEEKTMDINFEIMEGEKFYLNKINFTGNSYTRDKVMRREFLLNEGDVFDASLMEAGKNRLEYLQFFKEIKPTYEQLTGLNAVDLNVNVKDEGHLELQFGVSYGGYDKFGGSVTLKHNNFLGLGHTASIDGYATNRRLRADLNFTNYWLFDKPLQFGARIYATSEDFYTYDENTIGSSVTFGKRFTPNIGFSTMYKYEVISIKLSDEDTRVVSRDTMTSRNNNSTARDLPLNPSYTLNVAPTSDTSSTTFVLNWDNRNRRIRSPSKGILNRSSFEIAGGPLGGENYFYKLENELDFYIPLAEKLVLANKAVINYADSYAGREIPIFERYYIGGPYSIRGFDTKSIGPKDINNNPIGGNKKLFYSSELIFSLNDLLQFVLFYDAGDVFDDFESYSVKDLRTSYGGEIRIYIPIFPYPLRLIYADPIKPYENDRTTHFEFSIGLGFD